MSSIVLQSTTFKPGNRSVGNEVDNKDSYLQAMYIACEVVGCFILIATMYILLCLFIFGNRTGRWRSSGKKSGMNRGTVYTAAVVTIALTIPRYIANQLVFNAHNIPNGLQYCEAILDFGNICYFTSMTAVYIFLWIRQRALYGHPAMKRLAGKYVNYISWATLVVLTGAGIAVLLWFVIPNDYTHSKNGCVVKSISINSTTEESSYSMDYIVLLSLLIIAQVSLLSLFIYPMIRNNAIQSHNLRRSSRHKNVMMFVAKDKETVVTNKGSKPPPLNYIKQKSRKVSCAKRRTTVERTIRRTVICAAISMLSDLATMVVASFALPSDIPRSLHNIVYDVGVFTSALCIFGTFRGCMKVFTVLCTPPTSEQGDSSYNTSERDTGQNNKSEELTADHNSLSK